MRYRTLLPLVLVIVSSTSAQSGKLISAYDAYLWGYNLQGQELYHCETKKGYGKIASVTRFPNFARVDLWDGIKDLTGSEYAPYCLDRGAEIRDFISKKKGQSRAKGDHKIVSIIVVGKDTAEGKTQLILNAENVSSEAVRAFKGRIVISDIFGDELGVIPFKDYRPMPAGASFFVTWADRPITNREVDLANAPYEDLQFIWLVEQVIFADGRKYEP